ncbi:MAG: hypothetical protein WCJ35_01000 [Planctomycetota bacterium]
MIASSPSAREGDSTPWFASFWEFCGLYGNSRFGTQWHLSPEQSMFLHAHERRGKRGPIASAWPIPWVSGTLSKPMPCC